MSQYDVIVDFKVALSCIEIVGGRTSAGEVSGDLQRGSGRIRCLGRSFPTVPNASLVQQVCAECLRIAEPQDVLARCASFDKGVTNVAFRFK